MALIEMMATGKSVHFSSFMKRCIFRVVHYLVAFLYQEIRYTVDNSYDDNEQRTRNKQQKRQSR